MNSFKNVDQYIALAPKEIQGRLQEIRKIIKDVVPSAEERISYSMPAYKYHGWLAYFAFWEKHIGLYGIKEPVRKEFEKELKGYEMTKGTIQLPLSEKLQTDLIKKLIKGQAKLNEDLDGLKTIKG